MMKMHRRAMFVRAVAATAMLPAVMLGAREEPVALAHGIVKEPDAALTISGHDIVLRDLYIQAPNGIRVEQADRLLIQDCTIVGDGTGVGIWAKT